MMLRHLFPVVHDAETGAGAAAGATPPPAGDPAPAAAEAGSAEGAAGAVRERPEYIPEKFWDADARAPRLEDLAKSYGELERWKGTKAETLKAEALAALREGVPAKPEDYGFTPPAGLLPEGFEFTLDEKDPFLGAMRGVMHELGAKPEQWDKAMGAFLTWQAASMPKPAEELAKLGEGAAERVGAVDAWLAKQLPEAEYRAVAAGLTTADGVAALERLMRAGGSGLPAAVPGGAGGGNISEEQAVAFMRHADYRHEHKGRAMREQVERFVGSGGRVSGYGR